MDGLRAVNELNDLTRLLGSEIKKLGDYGRSLAEAEKNYKVALMQETLKLRDGGMAVTKAAKLLKRTPLIIFCYWFAFILLPICKYGVVVSILYNESNYTEVTSGGVRLVDKVVFGKVSEERFKRDVAEVMYKTAQEEINGTKLKIRVLAEQIAREWGHNE